MVKSFLTIPCHWNKEVVDKVLLMQSSVRGDIVVSEIYGTLAKSPIGHGRAPRAVPDISKKQAVDFKKYVESCGLKFNYLINAPFSFKGSRKTKREIKDYISWITEEFQADALTVASHELMQFIREIYPNARIHISTIAGIKNINQFKKFLDIKPSRLVPHHDVNRNFQDLKKIIVYAKKRKIEVELMATESCLRRCPNREEHYKHLGGGSVDTPFHATCNTKKILYPHEFLKANFIRPEDLSFYERLGVNIFKITGRSKPADWLPEVAGAYLKRRYDGNLVRLLGIDPSLKAENWVHIRNKSLDGFLENFPKNKREWEENLYCNKWIEKLYKENNFAIKDGSKYKLENDSLFCYKPGKKTLSVISKEENVALSKLIYGYLSTNIRQVYCKEKR